MAEAEKDSGKKKEKLKYLPKVFKNQASTEGGEAETKQRQRQISNQSSGSGHSFRRDENDILECFGIPWRCFLGHVSGPGMSIISKRGPIDINSKVFSCVFEMAVATTGFVKETGRGWTG